MIKYSDLKEVQTPKHLQGYPQGLFKDREKLIVRAKIRYGIDLCQKLS